MTSPQTLSDADRRLLAGWAADCATRVLPLLDADASSLALVRDAVARAHAYGRGGSTAAAEIRQRMVAVTAAGAATTPAGAAAARAAGQASAVAHLAAHALGAAAYAAKAVSLAHPDRPEAVDDELRWQVAHLTQEQAAALRRLPLLESVPSGPLGPGLLSRGVLGRAIREIQARIGDDVDGGRPAPAPAGHHP
ncbi:hypothetical protein C8046_16840 [Serinibacter arcticus]|uniref:Imm-5-like domain-containing protein n=1 Tax=Serinibacter arcticus TaxID=1655435 RepID=A0A2U1ZYJ5_9MICO|nr:hypothetical protein [Serinibacter arcticus]PWD52065.1 hypothetical protein C8046_16840 [Serinibacter arcticus]